MSGFSGRPKILRGAFVEYGLNIPPLVVPFQFNPEQLSRSRSVTYYGEEYKEPVTERGEGSESQQRRIQLKQRSLRETHERYSDLQEIRNKQKVTVNEETISFDIRLDATDALNDGDAIAGQFGIAPRLATLELMAMPKGDSVLGAALESLISTTGFTFTGGEKPPMILFIWGRTRVMPVNIDSMSITETEFNTQLSPVRATVSVSLTVIEGRNDFYKVNMAVREGLSLMNLANITDIMDVVIPG